MKIQTVKNYIKDYDFRQYAKYVLCHIGSRPQARVAQKVPPYLERLEEEMEKVSQREKRRIKLLKYNGGFFQYGRVSEEQWKIYLAGKEVTIDRNTEWNYQFADDEDMAALHRFIWLYNGLIIKREQGYECEGLKEQVLGFILSWIQRYKEINIKELHPEIFQTYSVAERVVNWLYSLSVVHKLDYLENSEIYESIFEQVKYICNHLEYYGEFFTGNHLSNDGKAVYIAGMLLGIKEYQEIGKEILIQEVQRIITDQGFLREGSVHYQFLITKNYAEVYWVAKQFGDRGFQRIVAPYLLKMANACGYFLIDKGDNQWEIPLIGDISPDYKPEWIIGAPWIAEWLVCGKKIEKLPVSIGWHNIFRICWNNCETDSIKNDIFLWQKDWGKLKYGKWLAFFHVNHSLYPNNLTGHFHHDTGAIVLYHDGNCILCDCGRYTYENIVRGIRDKSMEAHCGIKIDGVQPEMDMRTFYPSDFIRKHASRSPSIVQKDNVSAEIWQYGFQRLKNVGVLKRVVEIEEETVQIRDVFEGRGRHKLEFFFHTEEGFRVEQNQLILITKTEKFIIEFNKKFMDIHIIYGKGSDAEGKMAISYGESRDICSAICVLYEKFPCTVTTRIKIRR